MLKSLSFSLKSLFLWFKSVIQKFVFVIQKCFKSLVKCLFIYSSLLLTKSQSALLITSSHAVHFARSCSVAPPALEGIHLSFAAFCGTYRKLWMGEGCLQELKGKATAPQVAPSRKTLQSRLVLFLPLPLLLEPMGDWSSCVAAAAPFLLLQRFHCKNHQQQSTKNRESWGFKGVRLPVVLSSVSVPHACSDNKNNQNKSKQKH